jgi:hypothetical protein
VLNAILSGVIQRIGPAAVGHAKAVAHVEGGIVHASTTGTPPVVETNIVGSPAAAVGRLQVDVLCVFHGVKRKTLEIAWQGVLKALSQDGFQVTALTVTPHPGEQRYALPRARIGILASLLPSVLVIKPCCLIPTISSLFGGSVGVLHIFAPLEPYRPIFMLASLGLLGSAFYHLYLCPPTFNSGGNKGSVLTSRFLFWIAGGVFAGAALYR